MTVFLETLWSSIKQIKAPYVFDGYMELICMQCSENEPHLAAKGKSHGFSRVSVGTWHIFSSYCGDDPSKPLFVQQHQGYCLVTRDTPGISLRLHRAIQILLDVRQETQGPFMVAILILGLLSIFNKRQASSALEALNSAYLSKF